MLMWFDDENADDDDADDDGDDEQTELENWSQPKLRPTRKRW